MGPHPLAAAHAHRLSRRCGQPPSRQGRDRRLQQHERQGDDPDFSAASAHCRAHGRWPCVHGRQKRHRRRLPITELVAIRRALPRLRAPGRDHQSADAYLPAARVALHARLRRSRSDGGAPVVPRLRLPRHDCGDPCRLAAPGASAGDRRQWRRFLRAAPVGTALGRRGGPGGFVRARSALAQ